MMLNIVSREVGEYGSEKKGKGKKKKKKRKERGKGWYHGTGLLGI
jgi:hypothetical protein